MMELALRDRQKLPALLRWGIAVGSCLLAVAVNRLISDGLFPSLAFVAAVMVTVHVGGKGPGILAFLIAGLLLDFYYIPPVGSFSIHPDAVPSLVQLAVPIGFGWWFIQRRKDVELLLERETAVSKRLQGELSYEDIGRAVLDYLAPELGSPIAALYTLDADGTARRCAGYAFDMTKAPETFARGDGAIGQVASESRPQVLSVPPDYISVRSSLGARPVARLDRPTALRPHQTRRRHSLPVLSSTNRLTQEVS